MAVVATSLCIATATTRQQPVMVVGMHWGSVTHQQRAGTHCGSSWFTWSCLRYMSRSPHKEF
ncbi:hypothetical protein Tco_0506924, partial [Tanacetum coccineum]